MPSGMVQQQMINQNQNQRPQQHLGQPIMAQPQMQHQPHLGQNMQHQNYQQGQEMGGNMYQNWQPRKDNNQV